MITLLQGDDLGVPRIPEALLVEWREGGCRVVFSYAKQGQGITLHFAASRDSLRRVKESINDMVDWLFFAYSWCEMVFAVIGLKSVERIVKKCGFIFCTEIAPYQVYMRIKQ